MAVILSHESALAFWRLVRSQLCSSVRGEPCAPVSFGMPSRSRAEAPRLSRRPLPQALNPLPDACATRNEIARLHDVFGDDALELLFTDGCLHACVPSVRHGVDRWSDSPGRPGAPSGVVRMHSSDSLYPTGAFSMVAPDVYVSSPALCFCQLGESADLSQMVEVGSELCGSYSVCGSQAARESHDASDSWDSAGAPSCVFGIDRLIKPSILARQVERMPRIRGKGVATKALSYVLDGSGSPRETKLGIMLSFPRARGGFGCSRDERPYSHTREHREGGGLFVLYMRLALEEPTRCRRVRQRRVPCRRGPNRARRSSSRHARGSRIQRSHRYEKAAVLTSNARRFRE